MMTLEKIDSVRGAEQTRAQEDVDARTTADSHILVIEDDAVQAAILREFLELLRYQVRISPDGEQGLAAMREIRPDLVLLDVHLPDTDGLSLLPHLQNINPDVSVILMSADRSASLLVSSLRAGADEFLKKPLEFSELSIRLQNLLEGARFRKRAVELTQELEKEKELLSRYFSREIVESILNGESASGMRPSITQTTVMVFDLRNSTAMVEMLGPSKFAEMLNTVMIDLMDIVMAEGGSIVRLTGDGLLVTFANPHSGGADSAVECAERISRYFEQLRSAELGPFFNVLSFGIGIATGTTFAGNLGTFRRQEFTIVGNTPARAARLESLTKRVGREVVLDAPTMNALTVKPELAKAVRVCIRGRKTSFFTIGAHYSQSSPL